MARDPDTPAPAATAKTVRLALHSWPVDVFDHGVDNVAPLTSDGVDVPVDLEEPVRAAAKDAGLTVKKVTE